MNHSTERMERSAPPGCPLRPERHEPGDDEHSDHRLVADGVLVADGQAEMPPEIVITADPRAADKGLAWCLRHAPL